MGGASSRSSGPPPPSRRKLPPVRVDTKKEGKKTRKRGGEVGTDGRRALARRGERGRGLGDGALQRLHLPRVLRRIHARGQHPQGGCPAGEEIRRELGGGGRGPGAPDAPACAPGGPAP